MAEQGIRNHFSSVIVDTIKGIGAVLLIALFNVADEISSVLEDFSRVGIFEVLMAIGIFLAILLAAFVFNFLRWRKTYIIIDDENLIVNKNFLINKKVTTVRLTSIATVNFQQGIPERIFGTYRLQVDINSSVTADSTDFNLVFAKDVAEEIKAKLTEHLDEDSEVNSETLTSESILIYRFSFLEVLRHCFLNISGLLIIIMTAVIVVTVFVDIILGDGTTSLIGTVISLLALVVPMIWSMLHPLVKYQNFKIEKTGNRAVISYGLFTKRQYNVPLDKTNAVIVQQSPLARIFGLAYGEILTVGMGEEEEDTSPIFCLMIAPDKLREIIAKLRPDLLVNGEGEKSPNKAYIPTCIPYLIFGIGFTVAVSFFGLWWLSIPVTAFMFFSAWLSVKTKSLAVLNDKTVITSGVFRKRMLIVPNRKIQNMDVKCGPISKRLGIAQGSVNVLAASFYSIHEIGYFDEERFDTLIEKITYTE